MSTNRKPTLEELYPLPPGVKTRTRKFGVAPVSAPVSCTGGGFRYVFEDPQQGLRVRVAEGDDGRLAVEATCRDGALCGHAGVSVAITGTRNDDSIRKTVPLNERAADGGCRGAADFGPRADAVARLGDQFVIVVFLLVDRSYEVASPPPRGRRRAVAAGLAALAAAALVGGAALVYYASRPAPQPTPQNSEVVSHDEINPKPDEYLRNKPEQKNAMGGTGYVLHNDDKLAFRGRHPSPLKHQWLLHVVGSVRLVAGADGASDLSYTLRQDDPEWWNRPRRIEFLIIVTTNDVPAGWPEQVNENKPVPVEELLSTDERKALQAAAWNPDAGQRNEELQRILRKAFNRYFGENKCWFQVNTYKSENT